MSGTRILEKKTHMTVPSVAATVIYPFSSRKRVEYVECMREVLEWHDFLNTVSVLVRRKNE